MLKIEVRSGEPIERALKRYKRKHKKVKLTVQLRERKYFTKKSAKKREELKKAQFKAQYLKNLEDI